MDDDALRRRRARRDRIFLLDACFKLDPMHRLIYEVQGTTGVYSVQAAAPSGLTGSFAWNCSCPDFEKRKRPCKHVYFVRNRVLGQEDLIVDSRTLWSIATATHPNEEFVREDSQTLLKEVARKEYVGENCVICFEEMMSEDENEAQLVWCSGTCGKSVHSECYRVWSKRSGDTLCVHCRQPFRRSRVKISRNESEY